MILISKKAKVNLNVELQEIIFCINYQIDF